MLQVTLHLIGGASIQQTMTRHQKERIVRIMTAPDPIGPYVTEVEGERVEVPWRNSAYVSSREV